MKRKWSISVTVNGIYVPSWARLNDPDFQTYYDSYQLALTECDRLNEKI